MRRVIAAGVFLFIAAACSSDAVDRPMPTSTTTAATATTTAAPQTTTTTTTTPATTTTVVTEGPKSFYWMGEEALLGILTDVQRRSSNTVDIGTVVWVGISGEFVGTHKREIEVDGEVMTGLFLIFFFGDHSVTGEDVVGEFLVGIDGGPEPWIILDRLTKWYWVPFDPTAPRSARFPNSDRIPVGEFISSMEVGRWYPISLDIDWLDRTLPDFCVGRWQCTFVSTKLFSQSRADTDLLDYNKALHEMMLGERETLDGRFGYVDTIYLVPIYESEG